MKRSEEGRVVDYLEGLARGTIEPESFKGGLCFCLETKGIKIPKLKQIFKSWSKFSGEVSYPVPDPYNKRAIAAYERFHESSGMWEGEYGKLRKELCQYVADYIKDHGNPS